MDDLCLRFFSYFLNLFFLVSIFSRLACACRPWTTERQALLAPRAPLVIRVVLVKFFCFSASSLFTLVDALVARALFDLFSSLPPWDG